MTGRFRRSRRETARPRWAARRKDRVARPAGRRGPRRLHLGRARRHSRRRTPRRRSGHRRERRRHECRRDGGGLAQRRDRRGAEPARNLLALGERRRVLVPAAARTSRPDAGLLAQPALDERRRPEPRPVPGEPAQHQSFAGRDRRAHRLRSRARLPPMSRSSSARPMSGPARWRSSGDRNSRPIT